MIQLTGAQARALFDLADGTASLVLRAGGLTAPYPVVVELKDPDRRRLQSGTLRITGGFEPHPEGQ